MERKLIYLISLFFSLMIIFGCSENDFDYESEVIIDIDGNTYTTVKIGNQIWLAENLKTTRFNDGTLIDEFDINGILPWTNLLNPMPFYRWSETNDVNDLYPNILPIDFYGAMYNHFAIASGKLAPEGFRVPTVHDFIELEKYLDEQGHSNFEAVALKSSEGWAKNIGNGSNAFGFNALPNGIMHASGSISTTEGAATFATSSYDNQGRIIIQLSAQNRIQFVNSELNIGAAVRCIKE